MKRSLVLMLLGAILFLSNLGSYIAALRVAGVLKLFACGVLFGVGLTGLTDSLHSGTSKVQGEDRS